MHDTTLGPKQQDCNTIDYRSAQGEKSEADNPPETSASIQLDTPFQIFERREMLRRCVPLFTLRAYDSLAGE